MDTIIRDKGFIDYSDFREKCFKIQSHEWDHQQSLYKLLSEAKDIYFMQKEYVDMPGNTAGCTIMIQDNTEVRHFTELILIEDGLYYYADTYTDLVNIIGGDKNIGIKLDPILVLRIVDAYMEVNKAVNNLEMTLVNICDTKLRDCVDIVCGYGHLH